MHFTLLWSTVTCKKYFVAVIITITLMPRANAITGQNGLAEAVVNLVSDASFQFFDEPFDEIHVLPEYDFIIVGAGSAGCVMANRLTEISNWNILLIEAGGRENYIHDIPLLATYLQLTDSNWKYENEPSNSSCLGMENKRCLYPRGRVIGGSSVINFMIYTRGNRRDYDGWEAMGNPGWSFRDVLPYFLEIEDMTIPNMAKNKQFHSTRGELTISYAPYRTPLADAFVESGIEMGQRVVDYNGETQTGFSYLQSTTKNGTRWSASRAFLHPIKNRKNLHVKKKSLVTKILIDPNTKIAYGVEFVNFKKKYVVRASKEVILSAGAINSPKLLMLSGIGPESHLSEIGIPVIQNLKVGYNLMDHVGMIGAAFIVNQSVSLVADELFTDSMNFVNYFRYHEGPLSVPAGCEGLAFLDLADLKNPDGNPNIEFLFFGTGIPGDRTLYKVLGISKDIYRTVYKPITDVHSWLSIPILLKPKSRGRVLLKSKNPDDKPVILHDYFENPDDLELLLLGVRKMLEISRTNAFAKYGTKLHDIPIPGCEQFLFDSDNYWRCVIRYLSIGVYHLTGTCKMGPQCDSNAVVDNRLRVRGISRLRVIDASIMPTIPAAHTNVPSMMIGAKGADLVKEDWDHHYG